MNARSLSKRHAYRRMIKSKIESQWIFDLHDIRSIILLEKLLHRICFRDWRRVFIVLILFWMENQFSDQDFDDRPTNRELQSFDALAHKFLNSTLLTIVEERLLGCCRQLLILIDPFAGVLIFKVRAVIFRAERHAPDLNIFSATTLHLPTLPICPP
jgi:hypothetical protein